MLEPETVFFETVLKLFMLFLKRCSYKGARAFQNQSFIDPLQNMCSDIIQKILGNKPVMKSLLNKVAVLRACNFTKEELDTGAFL